MAGLYSISELEALYDGFRMDSIIAGFQDCRILVIGDLMLDEYVWGTVDRISPEAPVQIVSVKRESHTLGGAGNVVNNLLALEAKVSVFGVIGNGPYGDVMKNRFIELGADVEGLIHEKGRPTTRKTRIMASNQQVLRIDRETVAPINDLTAKRLLSLYEKKLPDIDLVLISDYMKGVLTEPVLKKVISLAAAYAKKVIIDPKGRKYAKYKGATLITPNKKEASEATGIEIDSDETLTEAGKMLLKEIGADRILITLGREGMALIEKDGGLTRIATEAKQVFDVSGAGDTVLSVMGLSLAAGADCEKSARLANIAAGIVVGKVGTATVTGNELRDALRRRPDAVSRKFRTLAELEESIKGIKQSGKKIVFTNGCFDLLHAGHIELLSNSRKIGDLLIVAIDDDESVRRVKGKGRPVINAAQRVRILCALDSVDFVLVNRTDELEQVIRILKPDIITKGSNYSPGEVIGSDILESYGGKIVITPVSEEITSSMIIKEILSSELDDREKREE